ncbi:MAG TPA: XRE family transcriptional regulator [Gammaproteobacteria bacterium]|nr:XRE family transcriptional regulator [Gammaproteobacteria bacterium]
MNIAQRLSSLRKEKGLTQQALASALDLHITQVKRYEAGISQPSLDALKKISKTLRVSIDSLVFDTEELTPDEDLALQFQTIAKMPDVEKDIIKELIEGMIIKYETQRWSNRVK